jgi:hypothetical protein
MGKLIQSLITFVAVVFGTFIFIKQDISLITQYGKTLVILGAFGIILTSVGTLFSTRGDDVVIHNKNLSLVYFVFVIIFGAATLYKGKEFINMISKTVM